MKEDYNPKESPTKIQKPSSYLDEDKDIDLKTDQMVDDIVAKEGDDLLVAEDERVTKAFSPEKADWKQKIKDFFRRWWQNPVAKKFTIAGAVLVFVLLFVIPFTRYFILNTIGIRSSSTLRILDDSTQQPLNNVSVNLRGKSAQTDKEGKVTLKNLKLGSTTMVVEKRGFAKISKKIVLGWGSNPQGIIKLSPQGTQFSFSITDYLSSKPIPKIEATSGDASALSDEKGIIKLTLEKPEDTVQVSIKAEGYREEKITFSGQTKDVQNVKMVPGRSHAFISKRSGKYDLYRIDIDGKNEQIVLAGTGSERSDIDLVMHPSDNLTAVVSTRDKVYNNDGYLMSTLTIIDLTNSTTTKVDASERIQIVNWVGNRLIYVKVVAGASAANAARNRLISYDYKTKVSTDIASANYFNDIQVIGGKVYYAAAASYIPGSSLGLYRVDGDGSNKKTILQQEVNNLFRSEYKKLDIAEGAQWFSYNIPNSSVTKLAGAPSNPENRVYMDSPDQKHSIWVDKRDGKGVLINLDIDAAKESVLKNQNGIKNPVYWLNNNTLVYRYNNGQETADYAISIDGGESKKIKDSTDTGGIDKWYY